MCVSVFFSMCWQRFDGARVRILCNEPHLGIDANYMNYLMHGIELRSKRDLLRHIAWHNLAKKEG